MLIEPDTAHIPRHLVPFKMGVRAAVFGGIFGAVFTFIVSILDKRVRR